MKQAMFFMTSALLFGSSLQQATQAPIATETPTEFPSEAPIATLAPILDTEFPTGAPITTETPISFTFAPVSSETPTGFSDTPTNVPGVPTAGGPAAPSAVPSIAPSPSTAPVSLGPTSLPTTSQAPSGTSSAPVSAAPTPTSQPSLAPTSAPTVRNEQAPDVAPQTMHAEGQVFLYNSTCPSDIHQFEDDLVSALANTTNANNVTAALDHCYDSYTAANYTLVLPIHDADKYEANISDLSSALADALRNHGYNNSGAEMLIGTLLFNPADGVECTLKHNDSDCQNGEFLRMFEVNKPAKFGGNCTIPEAIIMNCNNTSSDSGLSDRQIAGIVVGSVIGGLLLLAICCCLLCRNLCRSRARRGSKQPAAPVAPQSDAVRA